MKLLVGRTLRLPRKLTTRPGLLASWLAGVTALEILGRRFREETLDLLGQALILVLLLTTVAVHLHQPLGWLTGLTERARRLARSAWRAVPDFALDLRESPPLPRAVPPALHRILAALGVAAIGLFLAARHLPGSLREGIAPLSYTAWIALLLALHAVLTLGIALTLLHSARVVHRATRHILVRRLPRGRGRRRSGWSVAGLWVLILLTAGLWAPGALPVAGIAFLWVLAAVALHLPGNGRMTLLWRPASGGEARNLAAHSALSLQLAIYALLLIDLGLLAAGQSTGLGLGSGGPAGQSSTTYLAITTYLGGLFLWSAFGSGLVGAAQLLRVLRLSRCLRPRPADGPSLFVDGELVSGPHGATPRQQLSAHLSAAGWRARFAPALPRTTDVRVRVSPGRAAPDDLDLFQRWPLDLSPEALAEESTLARLARRRLVLLRRHLAKGFQRLFKQAQIARHRPGNGVWIGLQHWFHGGMTRDVEGDAEGGQEGEDRPLTEAIVGPPYTRVFQRAARLHYAEVLRALEVDLIFVEDGLGFRRFRRALGVLFETFDIHGGKLRVEERHFVGLPGTRAVLHELTPDRPFPQPGPGYPEPDYENIGRARILHLFKDRGGEEARATAPVDLTDLPVPVLVG